MDITGRECDSYGQFYRALLGQMLNEGSKATQLAKEEKELERLTPGLVSFRVCFRRTFQGIYFVQQTTKNVRYESGSVLALQCCAEISLCPSGICIPAGKDWQPTNINSIIYLEG